MCPRGGNIGATWRIRCCGVSAILAPRYKREDSVVNAVDQLLRSTVSEEHRLTNTGYYDSVMAQNPLEDKGVG